MQGSRVVEVLGQKLRGGPPRRSTKHQRELPHMEASPILHMQHRWGTDWTQSPSVALRGLWKEGEGCWEREACVQRVGEVLLEGNTHSLSTDHAPLGTCPRNGNSKCHPCHSNYNINRGGSCHSSCCACSSLTCWVCCR